MKLQGIREEQKCHLIQMSKDNNFLILGISFQCLCSNVEFGKFQKITYSVVSLLVFIIWSLPVKTSIFSRPFKLRLIPDIRFSNESTGVTVYIETWKKNIY